MRIGEEKMYSRLVIVNVAWFGQFGFDLHCLFRAVTGHLRVTSFQGVFHILLFPGLSDRPAFALLDDDSG